MTKNESQKKAEQLKEVELELFEKMKELAAKTEKEAKRIGIELSKQDFSKKELYQIVRDVSFNYIENERIRRKEKDLDYRFSFLLKDIEIIAYTQINIEE